MKKTSTKKQTKKPVAKKVSKQQTAKPVAKQSTKKPVAKKAEKTPEQIQSEWIAKHAMEKGISVKAYAKQHKLDEIVDPSILKAATVLTKDPEIKKQVEASKALKVYVESEHKWMTIKEYKSYEAAKTKKEDSEKEESDTTAEKELTTEEVATANSIAVAANDNCLTPQKVIELKNLELSAAVLAECVRIFRTLTPRDEPKHVTEARQHKEETEGTTSAEKSAPKEKKEDSRDVFGNRIETQANEINNAILGNKKKGVVKVGQYIKEIVKLTGLNSGRVKNHVKYLVDNGYAAWKGKDAFTLTGTQYKAAKQSEAKAAPAKTAEKKASKSTKQQATASAADDQRKCSVCKKLKHKREMNKVEGKLVCDSCLD